MKLLRRALCMLILGVFCLPLLSGTAAAAGLPQAQRDLYKNEIYRFNYNDDTCSSGSSGESIPGISSSGDVWQSGLTPPYILEQFAIEVLKDIAKKKGTTEDQTVTEEHVIALVAFMLGEGGDINNRWLFNPLNTGLNAPELIDGTAAGNGTQSFKSFDAGVEATARTMVGSFQSRLGAVLSDKGTSAEQFMDALTYYKKFPGNKFWAEASLPDPQAYYNQRLSLVRQVRTNYTNLASIVLGTPAREQPEGIRDPSKLKFHPTTDGSGNATTVAGTNTANTCATNSDAANSASGCGTSGLPIPEGGKGVSICYFNQADLSGGNYNWPGCGCLPTSILMIRATMEKQPTLKNTEVLAGLRAAGGVYSDGCSGVIGGGLNYLRQLHYNVETIQARGGGITDATLEKVKQALEQGKLVLTHTHTTIDSTGNKATSGHFLVVHAVDADGNFYVANPGARSDNRKAVSPTRMKAWLDEFYAVKN